MSRYFGDLLLQYLQSLPVGAPVSTYRRGRLVYSERQTGDSVYLLEHGLVKLYKSFDSGQQILTRLVSAGELFGEETVWNSTARTNTAEAVVRSQVLEIPRPVLLSFLAAQPEAWPLFGSILARRVQQAERKFELLFLGDVYERLRESLKDLSNRCAGLAGGGPEVVIPLNQKDLAATVGATRETASVALNSMARRGCVRLRRGSTTLLEGFE